LAGALRLKLTVITDDARGPRLCRGVVVR